METQALKKILAAIGVSGLIAGAGLVISGCSTSS